MRTKIVFLLHCSFLFVLCEASAQTIDFETLPGGASTVDLRPISNEYEVAFGVTFALVDPSDPGTPIGFPRIAKVGPPRTAFFGCDGGEDNPAPGQNLGETFLTDDTTISSGPIGLLISYSNPVEQASGVIIDIDCAQFQTLCEQWTIIARDPDGTVLDTVILNAPLGPDPVDCDSPGNPGPGNGKAFGWFFNLPRQQIASILITYTGPTLSVGLAFDNFSPALPCICKGDFDLNTKLDGSDIQSFVNCFAESGTLCGCADLDDDGSLGLGDIDFFVAGLLDEKSCL
jgi:hypothetical protein